VREALLAAAAVLAVAVSACAGQSGGSSGSGKPILVGVSVSLEGGLLG
jgi:hypothetical protein